MAFSSPRRHKNQASLPSGRRPRLRGWRPLVESMEDRVVLTAASATVTQLYQDLLHRLPDAGGLAYWAGQLDQGAGTVAVAGALTHSPEYHRGEVDGVYQRLLGRAADDGGRAFFASALDNGQSVQQVEAAVASSPEYAQAHPGASGFLDALFNGADHLRTLVSGAYQQVLHRAGDPAGLAYWAGRLADGASLDDVTASLAGSAERAARAAPTATVLGTFSDSSALPLGGAGTWEASLAGAAHAALSAGAGALPQAVTKKVGPPAVFQAFGPERLVDTRNTVSGQYGGPAFVVAGTRTINVAPYNLADASIPSAAIGDQPPTSNLPANVTAVSVILFIVGAPQAEYFTAYASGTTPAPTATATVFADRVGQVIAASAIVPVNASGNIDVYSSGGGNLIIDVTGYFLDQLDGSDNLPISGNVPSGTASGVVVGTNSDATSNSAGVAGVVSSTAPGALSAGVRGVNNGISSSGIGVYGSQAGSGVGVYGTAAGAGIGGNFLAGSSGVGVQGVATGVSSTGGVFSGENGARATATGTGSVNGVLGIASATAPTSAYSIGVQGHSLSTTSNGIGVYGQQDGTGIGVDGVVTGAGVGVDSFAGTGGTGTRGISSGAGSKGGSFSGETGVLGTTAATGAVSGVLGQVTSGAAAAGSSGVTGTNASSAASVNGVTGTIITTAPGSLSAGVRGINNGTGAAGIGVYGSQNGAGIGVLGTASGAGRGGSFGAGSGGQGVFASAVGAGSIGGVFSAETGVTADGGVTGLSASSSNTADYATAIVGTISSTAPGTSSAGVRGINSGTGAFGIGVYGSQAGTGFGVLGSASGAGTGGVFNAGSGGRGVSGTSSGAGSIGGNFNAETGVNVNGSSVTGVFARGSTTGVIGTTLGAGTGGNFSAGAGGVGVVGSTSGAGSIGGNFSGATGVFASGSTTGVSGTAAGAGFGGSFSAGAGGIGVNASAFGTNSVGVNGFASDAGSIGGNFFGETGVRGSTSNSVGVRGINSGTGIGGIGVYGSHAGSGTAVFGIVSGAGFGGTFSAGSGGRGVSGLSSGAGSIGGDFSGETGVNVNTSGVVTGVFANGSTTGVIGTSSAGFGGVGGDFRAFNTGIGVRGTAPSDLLSYGVFSQGNLGTNGLKNFVDPSPTDPSKQIAFVALEGNEAGTFFGGTGHFTNGTATIDVPESFRLVTDSAGLRVQVTPLGALANVAVLSKDLNHVVVIASQDVDFDYQVNGIRRGYLGYDPVQPNRIYVPHSATDTLPAWLTDTQKQTLIGNGTYHADGTVNLTTAHALGWDLLWTANAGTGVPSAGPAS